MLVSADCFLLLMLVIPACFFRVFVDMFVISGWTRCDLVDSEFAFFLPLLIFVMSCFFVW